VQFLILHRDTNTLDSIEQHKMVSMELCTENGFLAQDKYTSLETLVSTFVSISTPFTTHKCIVMKTLTCSFFKTRNASSNLFLKTNGIDTVTNAQRINMEYGGEVLCEKSEPTQHKISP
jgi:hypothetical protein